MFDRRSFIILLCSLALTSASAQRKPLDHTVYDGWQRIADQSIASDASRILYVIEPQEGDAALVIRDLRTARTDTIQRGTGPRFSFDGRNAACIIKPAFADVKKAKIAKKKPAEMPKDTLAILSFGPDTLVRIPRVKRFAFPEKGSGWIAYTLETTPPDSGKKRNGTDTPSDQAAPSKDSKEDQGSQLVLRRLADGTEFRYDRVSEFAFSKSGDGLLFITTGKDSGATAGVFRFDTRAASLDTLTHGRGTYRHAVWDENGTRGAFLADRDTSKAKQRFFALCYWREGMDTAVVLADTTLAGLRDGWLISEHRKPDFSKDGTRLFFGTAPIPMPEDTTLVEDDTPRLDVWNWRDPYLQTHQNKNVETERKRSYLAVIDPASRAFIQLGDPDVPSVTLPDEGNGALALGLSDVPYRQMVSWETTVYNDAYLIDIRTGTRTRILEKVKGAPGLSPGGRYVVWYDMKQRHWFTMDVVIRTRVQATRGITVPLFNELDDEPDDPGSYGATGWTENDSLLLVNDRYDIWLTDPSGKRQAACLTAGAGRRTATTYRYIRTDSEERFIRPGAGMLLKVFDNRSKDGGYALTRLGAPATPSILLRGPFDFSTPARAKNDTVFIFQKSSFLLPPDLYVAGASFAQPERISAINPQQEEYLWGSVELVSWRSAGGKPLDGLLFKPEGFDPKKKYPMIVYYYERMSDLLHRYFAPAPSASTINPTWCASNGYLVFMPDIVYRTGYPGRSAMECIVPGVKKLIAAGFVDPARIGLQGQSWGGYQTAFIVTRTDLFRAAMAGAPVSNMTSAYGGIRWESGMSRMFQYERAQSRIGGTLWEKRDLYIENSPLFAADRVKTPLLIMHNDADGAVPWYQGIELFTALRRLQKPVWMLTYNDEAHNLVQRKNRKDLSVRLMQFFDHYLKDAPAPVWMTRGIPAVNKGKVFGLELDAR